MGDDRRTPINSTDRFGTSQVGPVFLYLLGGRRHCNFNPYVDDILLLEKDLKVLGQIKQTLMSCFSMADMRDVSLALDIGVIRDRTNKSLLVWYGMASCNSAYTPGV